jgi:hypothetical protein
MRASTIGWYGISRRSRWVPLLAAMATASCGSSSGGDTSPKGDAGRDSGSPSSDSSTPGMGEDSGAPGESGAPDVGIADSPDDSYPVLHPEDVCSAKSGAVAWVDSIAATSSSLVLSDVIVGPTNDVIVADQNGATYEQHRWNESGTVVGVHQDPIGAYTGRLWTSNLVVDADNNLFYGMFMTGLVSGSSSGTELTFTKLSPDGSALFTDPTKGSMPTSDGEPKVLLFDSGYDSGGGLHGAFVVASPQELQPGVYCYGSSGSFSGVSAGSTTGTLTSGDFEWPSQDASLYLTKPVTATTNLGCSTVTVPAAGGVLLAKLDGGGSCLWNKLLSLPTAAVKSTNFRLGADTSLALAVVYSGTINFGGASLTSTGTSSLAVARFDNTGKLLFAKSFGGAGSSFEIGSVGVNAAGTLILTGGYSGTVDLGGGSLPASDDTFLATFDTTGTLGWAKTVTVGKSGGLIAAVGKCGLIVATNSPSVDLGTGPLSSGSAPKSTIGVAALGL